MTFRRWIVCAGVTAIMVGAGAFAVSAQDGFVRISPEQVKYVADPAGYQVATLYGDPAKAGVYVIRVKFPPGVMSRPHTHTTDRMIVVIKGPWYTGTSKVFDPGNTVPVPTAGFMIHPAGAAHFDGAKDQEVIVQITGMGPVTTTQLQP